MSMSNLREQLSQGHKCHAETKRESRRIEETGGSVRAQVSRPIPATVLGSDLHDQQTFVYSQFLCACNVPLRDR